MKEFKVVFSLLPVAQELSHHHLLLLPQRKNNCITNGCTTDAGNDPAQVSRVVRHHHITPHMKIISIGVVCVASLLLLGCSSSRCCSKSSATASGQRYSYDPVKDMTTIEKDGYTWYLKGNVTNVVLTPKATQ